MSTTITLRYTHRIGAAPGTLTDCTGDVYLSDTGAAFGVKNTGTDVVIVTDGVKTMTKESTGVYTYLLTVDTDEVAADGETDGTCAYATTYTFAVEYSYGGETKRPEFSFTTPTSAAASTRGTVAWACDEVELLTGVTTSGNALKHVQAGTDRVIAGQDPADPTVVHQWSWLPTYREINLPASDEDTCTGDFTSTSLALTTTNAFFSSTVNGSAGRYVEIEDVGLYRIDSNSSTTAAVCTAATGQHATDFATAVNCWFAPIMDLPSDFGGLAGELLHVFSDAYSNYALKMVSADEMMRLWRDDNQADDGVFRFCIVPKAFSQAAAQVYQLMWYPRQDYRRVMRYRCHVEGAALTDSSSVYFPGGAKFYDLFLQAGMAHAETYALRTFNGPHEQLFKQKMIEAIALDKALFSNIEEVSMADADDEIVRLG